MSALYAASPTGFLRAIGATAAPYDADRPDAGLLAVLRRATGTPAAQLRCTVLHVSPAPDTAPHGALRSRRGAWWMAGMPLYEEVRRWCPRCLGEDGAFWPLAWRLGAPVCFRHGVWLERRCPGCGAVQDVRPLAPSAICGRCATPLVTVQSKPFPAELTGVFTDIDLGLARFAGRGETRPPRSALPMDPAQARWRRLIAFARRSGARPAANAEDERDRLAAFLEAVIAVGALAEPAPLPQPAEQAQACAAPPSLLEGLSERVDAAITQALKTLHASGAPVTAATFAREADRVLRRTPDPARLQPVNGLAGRLAAHVRQ